jgi:hypothetical protein
LGAAAFILVAPVLRTPHASKGLSARIDFDGNPIRARKMIKRPRMKPVVTIKKDTANDKSPQYRAHRSSDGSAAPSLRPSWQQRAI